MVLVGVLGIVEQVDLQRIRGLAGTTLLERGALILRTGVAELLNGCAVVFGDGLLRGLFVSNLGILQLRAVGVIELRLLLFESFVIGHRLLDFLLAHGRVFHTLFRGSHCRYGKAADGHCHGDRH
ncbi:hypothetical protein CS006_02720 [Bifidobacterium primatium]|uniref:Uncharacterized protein n=1 Tax=Bifidobacterium primatium TaxID=2045438 RepID=A0A2M9HB83_9BIFI|nr:hypothetical protein [Bifidobacterium primatium]PJM74075.1 hypothetical protein CS006_02720 [Bifidobacterium primatium]